jgi:asparagine synthase (glutamine-hydrolysing)
LPGDILTKVDRASMANSLEVRVPILDHKLVEWIATISPKLKLKGSEGKYIFKKSLEPYLTDDILYRKKMGFSVPISNWFRNELKDDVRNVILSDEMLNTGLFNQNTLKTMLDQHQSGQKELSPQLWSLMMFSKFLQVN